MAILGTFTKEWKHEPDMVCRRCHKHTVYARLWESSDGAFEDWQFKCQACGWTKWQEGPDA